MPSGSGSLDAALPSEATSASSSGATVAMASITVEAATGGEVEDYQQDFSPTAVNLQNIQATLGSVPFVLMLFVVMALVFTGLGIALARRHRV